MSLGGTQDLIVQVRTNSLEVAAVSIVVRFDPRFLEVVDANQSIAGVQIAPHANSLLSQFILENQVDNGSGLIRYTVGNVQGVSGNFSLAVVTIQGKALTPEGGLTEVVFLVDESNETAASAVGTALLKNREDFTGAWIRVIP